MGNYLLKIWPVPLIQRGTLFEFSFFLIVLVGLFGESERYRKFRSIPTSRMLTVFFIYYVILTISNINHSGSYSEQLSYLRSFPYIFSMMLIISVPNSTATIKRIVRVIVISAFIISLVSIFIQVTGTHLPGLNVEQFMRMDRTIWGNVGTLLLSSLLIISTLTFVKGKSFSKLFLLIGVALNLIAILITQSRAMLVIFILVMMSWFILNKNILGRKYYIFSIASIGILIFIFLGNIPDLLVTRFELFDKEINISISQLFDDRSTMADLGRLGPLILSLWSNTGLQILFGKGYDPGYLSTSIHLHSGFGYVYSTTGIVGLFIVYRLLLVTIIRYRKFLKEITVECFEKEIMQIMLYYLVVQIPLSLLVGNLVQQNMLSWGLIFGLLELGRRSILNKYYNKTKVAV